MLNNESKEVNRVNNYIKDIEITCQVFEDISKIGMVLENNGFNFVKVFTIEDMYMCCKKNNEFVPKDGRITDSLIIRYVSKNDKKIICKRRNYDSNGFEISTAKSVLKVEDIDDALKCLNMLGYTKFLQMIDKNYMYENEEYIAYIQEIQDLGIFLELEAKNDKITTDTLIEKVKKLGLKIGTKFDIRKAELLFKKQKINFEK